MKELIFNVVFGLIMTVAGAMLYVAFFVEDASPTPVKQIFLLDCNHIPKGNFVGQIITSEEQFLEYKIKDTKFTYSGNYLLLTK